MIGYSPSVIDREALREWYSQIGRKGGSATARYTTWAPKVVVVKAYVNKLRKFNVLLPQPVGTENDAPCIAARRL
jgi:hypothetical protein